MRYRKANDRKRVDEVEMYTICFAKHGKIINYKILFSVIYFHYESNTKRAQRKLGVLRAQ